jgi:predicted nucleotidyltransferase
MLVLHKNEILEQIRKELEKKDKYLRKIILFGSVSRSEHTPTSDIDLLLVTTKLSETKRVFQAVRDSIFHTFSVPVTALYLTPKVFRTSNDPFIATVKNEGITLWKKNKT